jgi:hypothetical protein
MRKCYLKPHHIILIVPSSVETKYSTSVGHDKETYVTTKTSESVATEVKKIPVTSTEVETKMVCTTKGGYGGGY